MTESRSGASAAVSLAEIAGVFLKLGLISFGGPIAHLGYVHDECVKKRRWLDDAAYADLVALCQFLPGPASSQLVFALGMRQAKLPGAILASVCFTMPSAIIMIAFGYGVAAVGDLRGAGWLHGLKLAAVAVVAQAVWGMGRKLCPDRARLSLCLTAASVLLAFPGAMVQVGVIAGGALVSWALYRRDVVAGEREEPPSLRAHIIAALVIVVFIAVLIVAPILAATTKDRNVAVFDSFYRSGALVFGGGHVVLPLLRAEVVPHGWVNDDQFLAGYGAAQAVPGPLFTFAAYLGTVLYGGPHAWLGGLWCLLAIFLPAWLLIGGALPYWHTLRAKAWTQAGLRGANAAVVGILLAALYQSVMTEGVRSALDVAVVLIAFGLLEIWKAPPWLVVTLMALTGQYVL